MHDTAAIILAAGQSTRMGAVNKLLLPVGQGPMIRHVVQQYRTATDGPIVVVTGHDAPAIEQALGGMGVHCVFHGGYAQGQQSSVVVGLQNTPVAKLLLIGLGDQPLLTAPDICTLIGAHHSGDPAKISIPILQGRRGNPIVVPNALRSRLVADPNRPGCMRFTRDNPDLVQRHVLQNAGFYQDIDTPEDYENLVPDAERVQ